MKKIKPIDLNIYMVVWADACHAFEPTKEKVKPSVAADFGFLLEKTDDYIVLARQIFTDGYSRQSMTIPRGVIKDIRKVATVKMPKGFLGAPEL